MQKCNFKKPQLQEENWWDWLKGSEFRVRTNRNKLLRKL